MFWIVMEQGMTKFCVWMVEALLIVQVAGRPGWTSDDSSGTGAEVMMTGCVTSRRGCIRGLIYSKWGMAELDEQGMEGRWEN